MEAYYVYVRLTVVRFHGGISRLCPEASRVGSLRESPSVLPLSDALM